MMQNKCFYIILLLSAFSCNEAVKTAEMKNDVSVTSSSVNNKEDVFDKANIDSLSGVLILYSDSLHSDDTTFPILNLDGSVFTKIESVKGTEPESGILENKILAYYPDYYIMHLMPTLFLILFILLELGLITS
jgi:hypothetical protein